MRGNQRGKRERKGRTEGKAQGKEIHRKKMTMKSYKIHPYQREQENSLPTTAASIQKDQLWSLSSGSLMTGLAKLTITPIPNSQHGHSSGIGPGLMAPTRDKPAIV